MTPQPTLLIVDDQPENLAVLGELLAPRYRVLVATSGEQALRIAAGAPRPDLILLDITMPDMDGYTVLSKLRRDAATADIAVIFVTARDAAIDEEYGLDLGAADYISKPVKPAVVLARVHTQLENKQARDLLRDQNAWLESEVTRRMHDNEVIQNASLSALAILAETRDTDTGNHIRRTQRYVETLIESLRWRNCFDGELSGHAGARIIKAAPLHDIGKVGIPDCILNKPGKFTLEEFRLMQHHARIGGDAIATAMQRVREADLSPLRNDAQPLAFLEVARQIALWHHEKWDGSGYPDGLVGDAIPLPARIMAVADVFDALISPRVYKRAMSFEQASVTIINGSGSHFDPRIVTAFMHAADHFAAIAETLADDLVA
jgi:putative two-component system response regulator